MFLAKSTYLEVKMPTFVGVHVEAIFRCFRVAHAHLIHPLL